MGNCRSRAAIRKQDQDFERTCTFVRYAMLGDLVNVKLMLTKDKMDPNARDRFGMTALHWACYTGKLICIQELLQAGASTKAVDQNGRNALHHACRKDQNDVVRYLIQVEKMDPNSVSESKDTPLHKAVRGKGVKSIEVLLQNGADPHLRNDQNRTPLEELDSSPDTVTDVMQGEISTARVNEELEALRQDLHTHDLQHAKQRTRSMTFSGRFYGGGGSGGGADGAAPDTTFITRFSASIREFSEHQSSDYSVSSRSSSAHNLGVSGAGGTSVWARITGAATGSSSARNSARVGVSATPVELASLDLASLSPMLNSGQSSTPSALSSTTHMTSHSATHKQSANEPPPGRKSLKYAGKRMIMALRVKQMSVGEKCEMIRLLLQKHMQRNDGSSSVGAKQIEGATNSGQIGSAQPPGLQHHLSELKLSLVPDN